MSVLPIVVNKETLLILRLSDPFLLLIKALEHVLLLSSVFKALNKCLIGLP